MTNSLSHIRTNKVTVMIKNIQKNYYSLIIETDKKITRLSHDSYSGVKSFIQEDDFVYVLLSAESDGITSNLLRRNVIKVNPCSIIKWTVQSIL